MRSIPERAFVGYANHLVSHIFQERSQRFAFTGIMVQYKKFLALSTGRAAIQLHFFQETLLRTHTKYTPTRLLLRQAIEQYRLLFSPAIAISNSIGKMIDRATSIVAFVSERLTTWQGMPPSKSMRARLFCRAPSNASSRFDCKKPNGQAPIRI